MLAGSGFLLFETLFVRVTRRKLRGAPGLRAVQISDLHGRTRFLNGRLSDLVSALRPDVVFVTGDLTNNHADLDRVLDELGRIACPHKLFVPGNYEREDAGQGRGHKRPLSDTKYTGLLGRISQQITVLDNRGIVLQLAGQKLWVYGFDNSLYGLERLPTGKIPAADRVILLAHSPKIIHLIRENPLPFDALLVGHTHGGQVRLFGHALDEYRDYRAGQNPSPAGLFYVNRGLGTSRLPFRLGTPPEILLLEW